MIRQRVAVAVLTLAAAAGCGIGSPAAPDPYDTYRVNAAAYGVPLEPRGDVDQRADRVCSDPASAVQAVQILGRVSRQLLAIVDAYCPAVGPQLIRAVP